METQRLIIAITGASGAQYGIRLLEILKTTSVETHLVISPSAKLTLGLETKVTAADLKDLAQSVYASQDMAAAISSGSFKTMGMVIAPCSMKTLGEIASGVTASLVSRAADVVLKERRRLVLMVRESPLNAIHLKNMLTVTEAGAVIAPPVPAFYNHPQSLDEMVTQSVVRVLDLFDIATGLCKRWQGPIS